MSEKVDEKPETRISAKGIYENLNKLESCLITLVMFDILERFNSTSNVLQSEDTELTDAPELYESLITYLSNMRKDFDSYESTAVDLFGSDSYSIDSLRIRKRKQFFDEQSSEDAETSRSGKDRIRIEFFYQVIDKLIYELTKRSKAYETLKVKT